MTETTPRGNGRPGPRPARSRTAFDAAWGSAEPESILNARRPDEPTIGQTDPDPSEPADPMRALVRNLFPKPTEN